LWDEGFHLQLTCQWSKLVCLDILTNWFKTMKPNGWIPREQMRGKEAESNWPDGLTEKWKAGNPPSFIFVLTYLLDYADAQQDQPLLHGLHALKDRLNTWYHWFADALENKGDNIRGTF
jgi:hypothetical protein